MPTRIQHVGLVVSDLDRSRRFYERALGLEEIPRPPNFAFDGAWFRMGDTELHLLAERHTTGDAGQRAGPGAEQGMTRHVAFLVDDLEAALARLAEQEVSLAGGPMPRGDGYTQAFFLDPDGHVLELYQQTGDDQSGAPPRAPVRD